MRTIKFRAWAIASRVMFEPDSEGGWEIRNGKLLAIPNTVLMQFTGLLDKNGKEIYEGDLLKVDGNLLKLMVQQVVYREDLARFCMKQKTGATIDISNNVEVIGNIYENTNLLN